MLTPSEYHDALERDAAAFVEVVRTADAAGPVPACPGWGLADLGRHLGSVHRWARDAIRTGRAGAEPLGPADRVELIAWLTEGADALVATLRDTDPEAPTWTFGPPPHRVSFWGRRQAHETTIHLVDAQQSAGRPVRLDGRLAADGVMEVATMFFPRQVRLGRIAPLQVGLRIVLTDAPETAVLAGDGTDRDAPTAATITGTAADVLLVLWGRAELSSLAVDGDPGIARSVLAAGITP
jgi:uncharacterized protein (TIGR03083 family)